MSFVSWMYPFFLLGVCALHWALPSRPRVVVLAVASTVFYGAWDVRFLALMWMTGTCDYVCGARASPEGGVRPQKIWLFLPGAWLGLLALLPWELRVGPGLPLVALAGGALVWGVDAWVARQPEARRRRAAVVLALSMNLVVLGFFKYYGFFTDSAKDILGWMGWEVSLPVLQVVLPVGISFYTFQSLSYVIDCHRARTRPSREFSEYYSYLSFFPQLVAGPIERSCHLLPQLLGERKWNGAEWREGWRLILVGVFKKVYVADNCALVANYVFAPDTPLNGPWALLGAVAFAFQIYGDFSGYTDMARGSALLFGVRLCPNFQFPYIAVTPSDFWRRWHISLSSWFRDYVYIPLGGNRGGAPGTLRNLVIVMFLAGLWHGAAWTFVAWGLFHGALLVLYRVVPALHAWDAEPWRVAGWRRAGPAALMFVWVLLGWVLFRSADFAGVGVWLQALGRWGTTGVAWGGTLAWVALHAGPLLVLQALTRKQEDESGFGHWPVPARVAVYVALVLLVVSAGRHDQEFIYFQF